MHSSIIDHNIEDDSIFDRLFGRNGKFNIRCQCGSDEIHITHSDGGPYGEDGRHESGMTNR